MKSIYARTISLCPVCAADSPAFYYENGAGMYLNVDCGQHGKFVEKVENDGRFFRERYERDYERGVKHLVMPITYRCNLKCAYCYTLSNSMRVFPLDRPLEKISLMAGAYDGNMTLIGGEPTMRDDLPEIITALKEGHPRRTISVGTNGQKLADMGYLKKLIDSGMDFVFLSLNDRAYEVSENLWQSKIKALDNCLELSTPVWLQRTVDNPAQLNSIADVINKYRKVVFMVTIRAVRPFGQYYPIGRIFVSDIVGHMKKKNEVAAGTTPFNCLIRVEGKPVKVCSWVNDVTMTDPLDSDYIICDDTVTKFHRGMKMDEVYLMGKSAHSRAG